MIDGPVRAAGTLDLTVHRRDPKVPANFRIPERSRSARQRVIVPIAREAEGDVGATVCGKPLRLEELWVDYTPEPIDRLCPKCFPGASRDEYARTG